MLIIAVVGFLVLLVVSVLIWHSMGAPLYAPGMVRAEKHLRGPLNPPRQSGDHSYWLVEEDVRLFFTTQGNGRIILVIHGGPGYPLRDSQAGLQALAKHHTVICYDQRGCGKSTRPFDRFASSNYYANMKNLERTLGIGAQVADIERIRRILGEEKLILLGHSFGAFLAALYAAEFPEHVESLVLAAPAGVLVLPDESGGFFEVIRECLPATERAEYDEFLKEYLDFGSVFSRSEAELAAMNRRVGEYYMLAAGETSGAGEDGVPEDNGGWMVQALYFSMGKRHDFRSALKSVQARSLIVHDEADILPERFSRMYADCLPNSRLHVIKTGKTRGGHFPFREQPELFATLVNDFLAGKP